MSVLSKVGPYAKAVVGFVTPGLVILGTAITDASPGGSTVTQIEWVAIAIACITTGGVVFGVPNKPNPE